LAGVQPVAKASPTRTVGGIRQLSNNNERTYRDLAEHTHTSTLLRRGGDWGVTAAGKGPDPGKGWGGKYGQKTRKGPGQNYCRSELIEEKKCKTRGRSGRGKTPERKGPEGTFKKLKNFAVERNNQRWG